MLERLQKIISRAGIASRRHAEEMISSGLVTVNGKTITELGTKADESRDHIKVAGKLLRPDTERIYLLLNKPNDVVSTMSDPEGRKSLRDLLHGVSERVFPVGRLEYHATGLVFLTNDGDLANRILKSHRLPQTYQLKLKSLLTFAEIDSLSRAAGARISRLRHKETPWYEVTISDSRRDVLRTRLAQAGHPVDKLKRVAMGSLTLGSVDPGGHRTVSPSEIAVFSRVLDGGPMPSSGREHAGKQRKVHAPKKSAIGGERAGRDKRRNASRNESRSAHGNARRDMSSNVSGKPPANALDHSATHSFERSPGRPSRHSAKQSSFRPSERSSGRSSEQPTGHPSKRSSKRSTGRPPENSFEHINVPSSGRPDKRRGGPKRNFPRRPSKF